MNKYRILMDICETHSISKTAQRLCYTQSAVSQAVRSYETELGVSLFKRSKTGMDPLPGTERFFENIRAVCEAEERIASLSESRRSSVNGTVRLGSIQSIAYHWLPERLRSFSERYPHISFELSVDGFEGLGERLVSRELDIVFASRYAFPDRPFVPLCEDELMLALPEGHPLLKKETVTVQDIAGESFVLSADGLEYETGEMFALHGITPRIRYRINDDYAVCKMVESGFGVTVLPKLLLEGAPFRIAVRSFTGSSFRVLGAACLKEDALTPAARCFYNSLKEKA